MLAAYHVRVLKEYDFEVAADTRDEAGALALSVADGAGNLNARRRARCLGRQLRLLSVREAPGVSPGGVDG